MKKTIFHENTRNQIQFLLEFHIVFHWVYIKLNTKFEKLQNNKNKEQALLNLIDQYGVQKYFFISKYNEIGLCEVIM